jgi:hypothetical protein
LFASGKIWSLHDIEVYIVMVLHDIPDTVQDVVADGLMPKENALLRQNFPVLRGNAFECWKSLINVTGLYRDSEA